MMNKLERMTKKIKKIHRERTAVRIPLVKHTEKYGDLKDCQVDT